MKKTIGLAAWSLLAALTVTDYPATARPLADVPVAAQLKKGMVAFNRHNYITAGLLLQQPAQLGHAEAQSVLCYLHTYGRGVPQNYQEAAFWCHRAAEQGDPQAQYMLGLMYNKGQGVPENFVLAYKWLELAASRAAGPKRDHSFRIRNAVGTKMSPAQIAYAQALALEWRPVPELHDSDLLAGQCAAEKKCLNP